VTDLSQGWRFRYGDEPARVTTADFDDSAWEHVSIPHSWNRLGEYHSERTVESNTKQGVGWYRLAFVAPVPADGRRSYLQFDGVGTIADIWLNDTKIGQHRGAYSGFRFDVTEQLSATGRNLIVVKADNSKPAPGSSTQDVLPLVADFFFYGGIYRGVTLVEVDEIQIDMLDFGGPGVYARTLNVTEGHAAIAVHTRLRNQGRRRREITILTTILDADGEPVASACATATLAAGSTGDVNQQIDIAAPRLWNGRADPYLYSVAVELREQGTVLDRVVQPLGIRTFHVDADQGFFLNGKHIQLHGVSRHQDRMGKGWALSSEDHTEDMALIAQIGANTIRLAHYQHAQEWVSLADEAGMIAWAEVSFVTAASWDGSPANEAVMANGRQQLIELIRQQYNHPSIVMWAVGNEPDASAIFMKHEGPVHPLSLLSALNQLAKQEDPGRPTVFADCCEDSDWPWVKISQQLAGTADLIGYNRYYGWYYKKPADLGPTLDKFHAKHPDLPISVSEYGAGGALSQHTDNPEGGPVSSSGRPHPQEYQSWYHEENWQALAQRRFVFATWVWNMFDFASDMREEGESVDLNDKGLVSFDRKVKKDAFFFYQAHWSSEPVLHITGRRYVDRAYPVTSVRIYTNAPGATLTVNGVSRGSADCSNRVCVWRAVKLNPGSNIVCASAVVNGRTLTDSVTWNAPDATTGLHINSGTLTGRMSGGTLFGSDNFFVGGTARQLNTRAFGPQPAPKVVTGAGDLALHTSWREGSFAYELPLPQGKWTITVHSFEPDEMLAATRSFDILVNGKTVVTALSPAQAGGGALIAITTSFDANGIDGHLKLEFIARGGPAIVSAIDIRPCA
jgi:beta-galactosidase